MKILNKLVLFTLTIFSLISSIAFADVYVKGYYKKDGSYVKPHYRSSPNATVKDNYSTKGNINPYTGKQGTKSPNEPLNKPLNNNLNDNLILK